MKYCVECGTKLVDKFLEKEGIIPYCTNCKQFRFPIFNCAVSMIVVDKTENKILLIKQYGKPNFVLVAGYINRGEAAEKAVCREIIEEVGLQTEKIVFNKSKFFEPSNTLMINFVAYVNNAKELKANDEIDDFCWFDFEQARENIMPNSLAKEFLCNFLDKKFN